MKQLKAHRITSLLIILSIALYIVSMIIVRVDYRYFNYRWLAFWIHIFSLLILFGIYIFHANVPQYFKKLFIERELWQILSLLILAISVNFFLLSVYPYVSISDELRDGGLFTMQIASGALRNIFSYGAYDAYSLIIPTLSIPFYYIFGDSTLSYRVPAAILSSIDVLFLYMLVRSYLNRQIAWWAGVILATLPLHIFFAHTQVVVAYNFFWVPIILLLFFKLLTRQRAIDYIFLGTLLGFVSNFHAAVKVFAFLVFFLLIFLECKQMIVKKKRIEEVVSKIFLLICFIFVGFGPLLFFSGPHQLLHTSRFTLESSVISRSLPTFNQITTIEHNYIRSLMVYIYEPTTFFYPDHNPIFPPLLAIFFILGVGYAFFILKSYFLNILLFFLITIPFTNSAITDSINADQRISPLFSISSIFVAIGITYSINWIKNKTLKYIFVVFIIFYLIVQIYIFFIYQPANKNRGFQDYLSMHILYFLHADKQFQTSPSIYLQNMESHIQKNFVCVYVSPDNYDYFYGNAQGALEEQNYYLMPGATIQYKKVNSFYDNEVYILKGKCSDKNSYKTAIHTYTISCLSYNNFICPINYHGSILFHYNL